MNGVEATLAVIDAFNALNVSYMLVGSFSTNHYGIPRSTKDADFVVEFGSVTVAQITRQLGASFRLDPQVSFETVTGTLRHEIRLLENPFTFELFHLSQDPHDQERFRRRIRVDLQGRVAWLPTVEDVIITKLRWALRGGRAKDRDDVRDVIAVQDGLIDWEYVRTWCGQHGTQALLDEIRLSIPPA